MSAFTTFIQHSIGSPSNSDLTRKINKIQQIGKEELKVSLFPDNMIVYIENLINSAKKLLDLISEFGKVAGYKVNIQKSKAFLYTNREISETETRGKNPIHCSNKKTKVPRDKFNQGGKRLVLRKLQNTEERN